MPRESRRARSSRARIAAPVQALSVACFVAAAFAMVAAGSLHAAGRDAGSSAVATLGYAAGLLGITCGVLALILDPQDREDQ